MPQAFWRTPTLIILAGCLISLFNFGVRAGFGLWLDPMSRTMDAGYRRVSDRVIARY